jgi:hypothetical protein
MKAEGRAGIFNRGAGRQLGGLWHLEDVSYALWWRPDCAPLMRRNLYALVQVLS